ncbi:MULTISPECIES: M20 family metallopeptidase [Clostridium]|uniref:Amidohydrolase n=1 Tax=Clostridium faecium TaxID=2762223 RepID=A0ABR8YSG2_9CLOT|nr:MULTISPECIES: M20 family metallopeptidase [Clostridium]MBD8046809.1 amidohydrolase [Clostridium faecium]MDU1348685.1 M20 family metallopeptidase [Clostridium argentinense]
MDFLNMAKNIEKELIEIRRDLHRNPELGFDLPQTSRKIKDFLDREGISYIEVAKTGVAAIISGKKSSGENKIKTIAIRADMDALPLEDKKNTVYTSEAKGKMHACGHDAHTTMALGAAKILNSIKDEFSGNIKILFEPAEETVGGAQLMISEGVLNNPSVDGVIGLHVDENLECGKIGIKRGTAYAASNPFTIKIYGKGAHGASPHKAVDPIVIASQVVLALQTIVSREISPTSSAVVTIGTIKGGTAQNIIPEEVEISGILRTMEIEHRTYVKERLVEIVNGIVSSMRGHCEIKIDESYPCLLNNDNMYDIFENSAVTLLGREKVKVYDKPTMGVESFAYFSLEKPSMFYWLGCGNLEKGIIHPAHSCLFDIDEDCLVIGAAMHCKMALDFLNN